MAAGSITSESRAAWSWSAVIAGIVASLIVQVLLTMLALGVGLLSIDVPTANAAPTTVSLAALLWWIASGVFSAFVGGTVAGALTPFLSPNIRTAHALVSWAVAVLIVVGFSTLTAGTATGVATNMAGPGATAAARYQVLTAPGRAGQALTPAQAEQARKAAATAMLASFVGLLAGALAAAAGGWWARDVAEAVGADVAPDMTSSRSIRT